MPRTTPGGLPENPVHNGATPMHHELADTQVSGIDGGKGGYVATYNALDGSDAAGEGGFAEMNLAAGMAIVTGHE